MRVRYRGRAWVTRFAVLALAAAGACLGAPAAGAQTAPDPGGNEWAAVPVPPPPGKLLGFNDDVIDYAHGQSPQAYAHYISTAGGNVVRTSLEWWRAEQWEEDQWIPRRWSVWQEAYDAMLARGVTPLFVLTSAPIWARENPEDQAATGCHPCRFPPRPEMDAEWGGFVTAVASTFPRAMIQVWNEPNLHFWWGHETPDPERYAELVEIAYDAVQEVETQKGVQIPVIAPSLANIPDTEEVDADPQRMSTRDFLDAAYAAPAPLAEHIDGIALNVFPHSDRFGANSTLAGAFRDVRAARRAAGDDSKIYVTEVGLEAGFNFPFTEAMRALAMYRLYNRLMTMDDVGGVIFHRIIEPVIGDPGNLNAYGYAWMRFAPVPGPQIQAAPPAPKLVYCVFAELARGFYPQCLEVAITRAPQGTVRKRRARFFFNAPVGTPTTFFKCAFDKRRFQRCRSGKRYSLRRGRHRFRVRAVNSNGHAGAPAKVRFRVKKKRRRR